MTPHERETVITTSDGDDLVHVWTAQRPVLTRLRSDDRFTETGRGRHDGTEWAAFTIPSAAWNPATGAKRRARGRAFPQRAANTPQQRDFGAGNGPAEDVAA